MLPSAGREVFAAYPERPVQPHVHVAAERREQGQLVSTLSVNKQSPASISINGRVCLLQVGGVPGWQALLSAVGFRLDFSGSAAGLPATVFFPTSDPGDRLQQCSTTLQSLLGTTASPRVRSRLVPVGV